MRVFFDVRSTDRKTWEIVIFGSEIHKKFVPKKSF